MKKKRIIPVLLLRNGWLVQSKGFTSYKNLGNPLTAVTRLSTWASDELIYLDISSSAEYDLRRDDLNVPNRHRFLEIVEDVSREAFMPLTVGGGVRTTKDIESRIIHGADKVAINSAALADRKFINRAAKRFGSQCITVSIDVRNLGGKFTVFSHGGSLNTGLSAPKWAKMAESEGAGEILLNSVDRDGSRTGYDLKLLDIVCGAVKIPVIALGGVGEWGHFAQAFEKTGVDAVAAANIFHYIDQSIYLARKYLFERGYNVRAPEII